VPDVPRDQPSEQYWRDYLTQGEPVTKVARQVFTALPSDPRCRLCTAPFSGVGGRVMRLIGRTPSRGNPHVCSVCQNNLIKYRGGAEVVGTMLFADVRGSTALAETMSPTEFRAYMQRFYETASHTVFEHDGAIDKFVGDELVAMFYPALAGPRHVARAVEAATALLEATGHAHPDGPWAPVGAGIHTGPVWFGAVGEPPHVELTSLGDVVNTTARLAAAAGTGEILVSSVAATAAGLEPSLPRRTLELRGKAADVEVVVLSVAPVEAAVAR
jgi:adenylate cyclase